MTSLQTETSLRLKVDGFRKPLRLRSLRRDGSLETFAVEGEALEAVRFVPPGAMQESDGQLTPIPEAAAVYAAALNAFEALGRKLQTTAPRAAVRVEAVVRAAGGCFWLQAATGPTLETWLADHPAPVVEPIVTAFARRLAEALTELHEAGLVHGDLSPRNVMIDGGEVRLTGFMVDRRPFFRALRSQQGLVEPGYAPPEAHDGALRHPIGPAADLYAASAILQRLLTGGTPPAANAASRVVSSSRWPDDIPVSPGLRVGIEAGLAPAARARPADAKAWLNGLDLGPAALNARWFEGQETAPLVLSPPEAALTPDPEPDSDPLHVPLRPIGHPDLFEAPPAEAPLMLARSNPARRRLGWWVGGGAITAVAIAAVALVAPTLDLRHRAPPSAAAPKAVIPVAPTGCQWLSAAGGWRLRCPDASAQGLRLPERFDAQTTARAAAGEPASMERLGAFYRLRAGETANPDRGAYAYQALGWLQRAADTPDDGKPDTARARDDAALALGQMLARGEGGRAPDPAAAEDRLRQAAAGSRADAVLALGQLLEARAGGVPEALTEARGLYARVAQLGDGSILQREAERGLARIDAAAKPLPVETPARPEPPVEEKAPPPARKPEPKPVPTTPAAKAATKPPVATVEPPKRAIPVVRSTPKPAAATPPARPSPAPRAQIPPPAPRPALRTWTASTFIKVDPTTNFSPALELAGRAACDSEGGETLSVRAGDTICPNGVNYCQVRAVATCQGARP